jgi:transposase
MAAKPITMHQIRQILELAFKGKGQREIARITGFSKNTVRVYLSRSLRYNSSFIFLLQLEDSVLKQIVLPSKKAMVEQDERYIFFLSKRDYYFEELHKTGVTKLLLWNEYRAENKAGYGYTQFCNYLSLEEKKRGVVMHFSHTPGDVMQVDYAGDLMHYVDKTSGELIPCQVLVCVLPYSNMTFVMALKSQKQDAFIEGICKALEYFGGVPLSIKSDNLKSAVTKANRYEPTITEALMFLGAHYSTTITASRVYKPRDKASVEKAVDLTYKNIYAPLRDRVFHSMEEMNIEILQKLNDFNDKKMQKKPFSRREAFNKEEKSILRPLPTEKYELKHTVEAKVQKNYHIILGEDKKQYSVPFQHTGQKVKVIYTYSTVEIYLKMDRIALHKRDYTHNVYITNATHMPTNHKAYWEQKGWNKEDFEKQALSIGTHTYQVIQKILEGHQFIEQSYNSCLGVLRLKTKYGKDRLENACKRALKGKWTNYKVISTILATSQDKLEIEAESSIPSPPDHDQIRGASAYQ